MKKDQIMCAESYAPEQYSVNCQDLKERFQGVAVTSELIAIKVKQLELHRIDLKKDSSKKIVDTLADECWFSILKGDEYLANECNFLALAVAINAVQKQEENFVFTAKRCVTHFSYTGQKHNAKFAAYLMGKINMEQNHGKHLLLSLFTLIWRNSLDKQAFKNLDTFIRQYLDSIGERMPHEKLA